MSDGVSGGGGGLPVAGWYPDPAGTPQERWWGGLDWTEHLRDVPPVAPAWPPAATVMPVTSAWSPGATAAPTGAEAMPTQAAYRPMSGWDAGTSAGASAVQLGIAYRRPAGSPNTVPVWFIVFSAVVVVAGLKAISFVLVEQALLTAAVASVVFLAALFFAAVWDNWILKERNLPAASPAWLLLGPLFYLIFRSVALSREGYRHSSPIILLVLSNIAVGAISAILVGPPQFAPPTALAMQTVEKQAETALFNETSEEWTVTCPTDVPIGVVGTEFECAATQVSTGETSTMTIEIKSLGKFEITKFG